ncbi:MAG: sensor histidine kinase [Mycobacteriaceae bacterium]
MSNDANAGAGPRMAQEAAPERVIAVLRVLVVVSMAALVAFGTPVNRTYLPLAVTLVSIGWVYAGLILVTNLRGRWLLPQAGVTAVDGALTVALIATTGGAHSLVVATLPLAIVASAARQGLRRALLAALGTGVMFAVIALTVPEPDITFSQRLEAALWWSGYLVAFAVLTGALRQLLDREHDNAVEAKAEALSENLAIAEERDLRARLLEAQQAREDGLRVVLHEFRTPVSSLGALATSLATPGRLDQEQQSKTITLMAAHARHLTEMLDSLADVALRTGDPRGVARVRRTSLEDLAYAALDAAAVPADRSRVHVAPPGAVANCDDHRLRRVMTNLLENAARHGGDRIVDLRLILTATELIIQVADRGPGLPTGQATVVTRKFVSLGERACTAGLGLWIVEQLVTAMNGTFTLEPRSEGGLVARVVVPLA